MKNYKVIATRYFRDSSEIDEKTGLKVERKVNDEFYCTKERYEFLKANNAVKLVEIVEEKEQWDVTEENGSIHVRPVVDGEIIDTPIEKIITYKESKPKKKKSSKK